MIFYRLILFFVLASCCIVTHRLLCHSLVPSERYSANLTSRSPLLEERRGRALFDNLSFVVTYQFYFLYSTTFSTCSTMLCCWMWKNNLFIHILQHRFFSLRRRRRMMRSAQQRT